ncbi:MAG TPA: type II toxin-antitoxin system PemK/MazF family toxin [Ferruginibacter sp.]|jgi:hypothetical protein|nr:type II toxin-antitoxin system PemK/MazF family toxin [Ferruginibacter sp.]
MALRKWDVVFITQFPNQEDKTQYTKRPAIILEVIGNRVKACCITKEVTQQSRYTDTILIGLNTPESKGMNLPYESIVVLDRMAEIDSSKVIDPPFGRCPGIVIKKIKEFLSK